MKRFLALIMTLVLAFSMSAIAAADETVTISLWSGNEAQQALLKSFVDEYAAANNTKIDVVFQYVPYAEYNTKLMLNLNSADAAPDLFWCLENAAPTFIASGYPAALDAELAAYNPEDLSAAALNLWQKDGATYAVPFSTSPVFIAYNKDILEQAGIEVMPAELYAKGEWTWEKFREIAKQIKDKTGVWAYQTGNGEGYTARVTTNLLMLIRSYGSDAWDAEGNVTIDNEAAVQAVKLFHDMVYVDGSIVPPGDESSFVTGTAAMTSCQKSELGALADVTWKWDVAPIPAGPAGEVPMIGQAALCANSQSPKADLAKKLVAYMTSEPCVARMAIYWPPARYSVLNSEAFLSGDGVLSAEQMERTVVAGIATGKVLPSHEEWAAMSEEARIYFDELWSADADVAAALAEVAEVYRSYM